MAVGTQRRLIPLNAESQPQVSLLGGVPAGGQWAEWGLAEHSWQKQCDRPAFSPPMQKKQVARLQGGGWETQQREGHGRGNGTSKVGLGCVAGQAVV